MSSGLGTYTQLDRKFDQDMIYWLCITRGTSVTIASPSHIQKYPEGLFLSVHHGLLSSWYSGSRHGGCHG